MNGTKVVVMHRGGLAFYVVTQKEDGRYHACLHRYDGKIIDCPPAHVGLMQQSGKWHADGEDNNLVQELGRIIKQKLLNGSSLKDK